MLTLSCGARRCCQQIVQYHSLAHRSISSETHRRFANPFLTCIHLGAWRSAVCSHSKLTAFVVCPCTMRPGVEFVHQMLGEKEVRTLDQTPTRPTPTSLPRSACTRNVISPVHATSGDPSPCPPQARCAESNHPDERFITPANPEPSQVHSPHGRSPGPVAGARMEAAASNKSRGITSTKNFVWSTKVVSRCRLLVHKNVAQ
jgi:hypothetical protein